ncbi:MAG TPA: hypothetical protein PLM14_14490 [Candidatus Hydrogenedentes bacterium]|nr:hypothetical protein [Candidatus Hydrogenedentota bacterium]HQE84207.1 hypothetical protein [Candidatus Hydrogenedentota bacterium]HQH53890.1 hypothetical protein [Candidatus Hydrogenedentota bacterium]HQM48961.1 hypothetical protein [Candidatus Hydrogenedentota bacterium]
MPVKYECPKCGRRFTEWGAEKVGFKCPKDQWCTKEHPDDVELVRVGSSDEGLSRRPTLKRTPRKIAQPKQPVIEFDEDEALVPDVEELEAEEEFEEEEEEELVIETEDEETVAAPEEEAGAIEELPDEEEAEAEENVADLGDSEISDEEEMV